MSRLPTLLLLATCSTPLAAAQSTLFYESFDGPNQWTYVGNCASTSDTPWNVEGHPSGTSALTLYDSTYHGGSWSAYAKSPVIDISAETSPQLTFWTAYVHEAGCAWDANRLQIIRESDGALVHAECLSSTAPSTTGRWAQVRRDLDPAWGEIRIVFSYDPIDSWNLNDWGYVVDDVRVSDSSCGSTPLCLPTDRADGTAGPTLVASGELTSDSVGIAVVGAGFTPNTFAAGFIGPRTAILPLGNGTRCIAGDGSSRRLAIAPTRDMGTPRWTIEPDDPIYGHMLMAGESFFVQAYFRDGASFSFSEAIRVDLCE